MSRVHVLVGDCLDRLRELPDGSVHCCVTSPPYWGLRDYGHDGQIGLEETPEEYASRLVAVFREVRRVLRDDGTLWLNLGDSYAGSSMSGGGRESSTLVGTHHEEREGARFSGVIRNTPGLKPKDLVGIPWRVAFALQADGWWLRSDIIWHKPNPMPESVRDRPTKAHEYVFLLSKSDRYWYDADAIAEESIGPVGQRGIATPYSEGSGRSDGSQAKGGWTSTEPTRNARSVWTIATQPFHGAHFATFPPELAARCIKAGCPEGGTVLDPFGGAGTTGLVAAKLGRDAVLCELNPEYAEMARERIQGEIPMFVTVELSLGAVGGGR